MSLVVVPRVLLEQLREFTFMFDSGRAGVLRGHIGLALAKAEPDDVPVVGLFSQASGFGPWVEGDHGEPLVRQSDHLAALAAVTAERDRLVAEGDQLRGQLSYEKAMQYVDAKAIDRLVAEVEALQNTQSKTATDVLAERRRQVDDEGWTPEHDDEHGRGELSTAAACYAVRAHDNEKVNLYSSPVFWPWDGGWKPGAPRYMLVKAGALILAEIERLDRAAMAAKEG